MAGALLRAKRAGEVVVRVSDIGAVLRVQSYLKEVSKGAAIAVGTTGAIGTNGSRMDDVVTGSMLREHRDSSVAVDAFGRIDIPLCPAIVGAVGAGLLHRGDVVGVAGAVRSEPGHHDIGRASCRERV